MIAGGLRARITCLNPKVMDAHSPAASSTRRCSTNCPPEIDPCAERGEFHTCAYDGPMFNHPVPVETGITVERDGYVFTDLITA